MDDTLVRGIIIDLTNIGVMDETPKASNTTLANKVELNALEPGSKQSTTSNEGAFRDKDELDVAIIYSTSLGPTPLNYA